ncbi:mitochondrial import inner membrane translocase subunit TIM50-like isoform X2 [Gordionus sp. m RMFG-2023]|uniref:mitochondrial import inner membrane translocase subunit TIM50-like isoform X2 n=1 Tax=Gordionus sp. m RMFG-2023 TaxID=3053472 RepID=UPI0031FC7DE7
MNLKYMTPVYRGLFKLKPNKEVANYGFDNYKKLTITANFSTSYLFYNQTQAPRINIFDQLSNPKSNNDQKQYEEEKKIRDAWTIKMMKYSFISLSIMISGSILFIIYTFGPPSKDKNGNIIEDSYSQMPIWKAYLLRAWNEINYYEKVIKEPSREKLLPDPLTEPYFQPPYTLVLELTDVLVHPEWTYGTGWRFKKRPGVDFFLQQVGPPLFEVVIYTAEQGFTAFPVIDSLDPHGFIMYRLFRDATRYQNGYHVKDLSCLNRDLSKVIMVDWNSKAVEMQPANAVRIPKWGGNDDDRTLFDLAQMLRSLSNVEDVRDVLSYYHTLDDKDSIEAFKRNQMIVQEQQEQLQLEEMERAKNKSLVKSLTSKLNLYSKFAEDYMQLNITNILNIHF